MKNTKKEFIAALETAKDQKQTVLTKYFTSLGSGSIHPRLVNDIRATYIEFICPHTLKTSRTYLNDHSVEKVENRHGKATFYVYRKNQGQKLHILTYIINS